MKWYGKINREIFCKTAVAMACPDGQAIDEEWLMEGCSIEDSVYSSF